MKQGGATYPGGYVGQVVTRQVKAAGVERALIENTLKTMIDAQQVEYLRKAGLPNEDWVILIEVHLYLDRDMTMWGFHKDTKGQTLFVNLNYHLDQELPGPEYVTNPPSTPMHDTALGIDPERNVATDTGTLPQEFLADLLHVRGELGDPSTIGAGKVPAYGYAAFVDEAIHHATPLFGHRTVKSSEFKEFLRQKYPEKYQSAKRAYDSWNKQWVAFYGFDSYLEDESPVKGEAARWFEWMKMADHTKADTEYRRPDFNETGMSSNDVDEMLTDIGQMVRGDPTRRPPADRKVAFFGDASIPSVTGKHSTTRSPLSKGDRPPLKRQMSQSALDDDLPPAIPSGQKRQFFRTWVRAVRRRDAQ